MQIHILTIFPKMFTTPFAEGIIARAIRQEALTVQIHDLRQWANDPYKSVDDHPYGGGAGMLMKIEPIYRALNKIKADISKNESVKVAVTSAKGKLFKQQTAQEFLKLDNLILICGRYEGIDQRVIDHLCDFEISIGQFVLSGGELAAMIVTDTIARLLPGVLGNEESLSSESHNEEGVLEYPHYTHPAEFITDEGETWGIPEVLLSGHHENINKWRQENKKQL
jgi:tRNA (guanine37-N1)-methyltransferase